MEFITSEYYDSYEANGLTFTTHINTYKPFAASANKAPIYTYTVEVWSKEGYQLELISNLPTLQKAEKVLANIQVTIDCNLYKITDGKAIKTDYLKNTKVYQVDEDGYLTRYTQ